MSTDINSEFNACMFRDHCRSMESEIAALRAEVERLRGHLQDSIRAETSGEGLVVVKKDGFWEITMPACMGPSIFVPNWPSTSEILRTYIPSRMPTWFVDNTIKLAERWKLAFGDGGAA